MKPLIEKQKIRHSFNRAAKTYNEFSDLQLRVGQKLIEKIKSYLVPQMTVIDLGCGTGANTKNLYTINDFKNFFAIDIAEELLKLAAQDCQTLGINMFQADFDAIPLQSTSQDLVFSNMALHWSFNFDETLMEIKRVLKKSGLLAFAVPLFGTFSQLIEVSKKEKRNFNHFYTQEQLSAKLINQKFSLLYTSVNSYEYYFKNITTLIKSIKNSGANVIKNNSNGSLKSKNYLVNLEKNYPKIENEDDFLLTYKIGFFVVRNS